VDFSDINATITTDEARKQIIGNSREWYSVESFGKIDLVIKDVPGWRRMPAESHSYGRICECYYKHKAYISDAMQLFNDVSFYPDNIVYIVCPPTVGQNLSVSPTWRPDIGWGIQLSTGEIRHVVTFGADAYTRDYRVLCHETGHIFGLPDLYIYGKSYPEDRMPTSAWDIMSCVDCARHFLGWHKLKLGWLSESNMIVLSSGQLLLKLTSFHKKKGN